MAQPVGSGLKVGGAAADARASAQGYCGALSGGGGGRAVAHGQLRQRIAPHASRAAGTARGKGRNMQVVGQGKGSGGAEEEEEAGGSATQLPAASCRTAAWRVRASALIQRAAHMMRCGHGAGAGTQRRRTTPSHAGTGSGMAGCSVFGAARKGHVRAASVRKTCMPAAPQRPAPCPSGAPAVARAAPRGLARAAGGRSVHARPGSATAAAYGDGDAARLLVALQGCGEAAGGHGRRGDGV